MLISRTDKQTQDFQFKENKTRNCNCNHTNQQTAFAQLQQRNTDAISKLKQTRFTTCEFSQSTNSKLRAAYDYAQINKNVILCILKLPMSSTNYNFHSLQT